MPRTRDNEEQRKNSISWDFLGKVMEYTGFEDCWHKWIEECISTSRLFTLINGSLSVEFDVINGLRQRDPLSPFLFNMVAELRPLCSDQ
jgi:hypothetical protein